MNDEQNTPLSESAFLVLLSLAEGPRHGYGILRDVEQLSDGRVVLSTGTLYGVIRRFLDSGWIKKAADPDPQDNNRERQAYNLTNGGRRVVAAEAARLETLVKLSRARLAAQEA
jgi:DNA-binding PadR family transcriptional regulator